MEDYWNKMQQKFIDQNQHPQSLPQSQPPIQNSQQIPKANNDPIFMGGYNPGSESNSNPYFMPYQYQQEQPVRQVSRPVQQFDGIIEPKNSGQGHYGFQNNNNNDVGCLEETKRLIQGFINENMSQTAKFICIANCVIWIIIFVLILKQF